MELRIHELQVIYVKKTHLVYTWTLPLESFTHKLILPLLTVGHISCAAATWIVGTSAKFLMLSYVE